MTHIITTLYLRDSGCMDVCPVEYIHPDDSTRKPIVVTKKHLPEALVQEQSFPMTASVDKKTGSAVALSTVSPIVPDSAKKETSSPWIEKYEMGTGKNKINVRIFKEPDPEPVSLETQEDVGKNPVDILGCG